MLSRLGMGLDRNAPNANLSPRLCTVSIIFKLYGLDLKKGRNRILVWIG